MKVEICYVQWLGVVKSIKISLGIFFFLIILVINEILKLDENVEQLGFQFFDKGSICFSLNFQVVDIVLCLLSIVWFFFLKSLCFVVIDLY